MNKDKLPPWYPDWDDVRAKSYMTPTAAFVGIAIAVVLFLRGSRIPALLFLAFLAISWFTVGKRGNGKKGA
jgi:hypothetical protein